MDTICNTLRGMNKLDTYKKALEDWSKPATEHNEETHLGFCYYFWVNYKLALFNEDFEREFPELFNQRKVIGEGGYHYEEHGYTPNGRRDRVEALKNAIKLIS